MAAEARRRTAARRRFSLFSALIALLGVFLVYLAVPNFGPVLRAARPGAGEPGLFTATDLSCVEHPGHRACDWYGEFRSAKGTVRSKVALYGGEDGVREGERIRARDVGRPGKVYRYEGTREWILTFLLAAVGLLLVLWSCRPLVVKRPVRHEAEEETAAS